MSAKQYHVKFLVDKPNRAEPYFKFELSCCLEGCNGDKGWGWPGDRKLIILEGDSDEYSQAIIEFMTKQAAMICRVLNRQAAELDKARCL